MFGIKEFGQSIYNNMFGDSDTGQSGIVDNFFGPSYKPGDKTGFDSGAPAPQPEAPPERGYYMNMKPGQPGYAVNRYTGERMNYGYINNPYYNQKQQNNGLSSNVNYQGQGDQGPYGDGSPYELGKQPDQQYMDDKINKFMTQKPSMYSGINLPAPTISDPRSNQQSNPFGFRTNR